MELFIKLQRREAEGNPICVCLVGRGQMGSGMVHLTNQMQGLKIKAISDINIERPRSVLKALGVPQSFITITTERGEAEDALKAGKFVITENVFLLASEKDNYRCF